MKVRKSFSLTIDKKFHRLNSTHMNPLKRLVVMKEKKMGLSGNHMTFSFEQTTQSWYVTCPVKYLTEHQDLDFTTIVLSVATRGEGKKHLLDIWSTVTPLSLSQWMHKS